MILQRKGRLLKTVNGKPHATEDDHISSDAATAAPLPTPPDSSRQSRSKSNGHARQSATDTVNIQEHGHPPVEQAQEKESDDPLRDPVSSDDEDMAGKKTATGSSLEFVALKAQIPDTTSDTKDVPHFKSLQASSILEDKADHVAKPSFCMPSVTSASITTAKRVLDDDDLDEDTDGELFSSSMNSSKPKRKRSKPSGNIHAPLRSSQKSFGSRAKEEAEKRRKREELARKKKEKKEMKRKKEFQIMEAMLGGATLPAAAFKRHNIPSLHGASTIAGATDGVSNRDGSSSPLSSLSASPEPDPMSTVCETCQQRVDKLLKEEYNDDFVKGKSWNIQWQERFCEWHRTHTAKEEWRNRGYPDINWTTLERRMQQHDDYLLSVLRNQAKSQHRDEYGAKVKAKSMSSGFKDTAIKPGATVGYYGPKGEKAMSEHILSGLSDEIRQRAKTDRLVSPSGYQGGISGFVQGVLVPHLAELLIKEDMRFKGGDWTVRVRELIAESAEIGELVSPEVADRKVEVEGEDDWALQ